MCICVSFLNQVTVGYDAAYPFFLLFYFHLLFLLLANSRFSKSRFTVTISSHILLYATYIYYNFYSQCVIEKRLMIYFVFFFFLLLFSVLLAVELNREILCVAKIVRRINLNLLFDSACLITSIQLLNFSTISSKKIGIFGISEFLQHF